MKTGTKILIASGVILIMGVTVFLLVKKKKTTSTDSNVEKEYKPDEVLALFPAIDQDTMSPVLDVMTPQELRDTYAILLASKSNNTPSADMKAKTDALTKKYGIFT